MNNKLAFKNRNQDICDVFDRAPHPSKVMVVALDYAKREHTALICCGEGEAFKAAFPVENSPKGLAFLEKHIRASMRRHGIPASQVIIGGEDCGSFSLNFIHTLGQMGYLVIGVNAKAAQLQRQNFQASTDKLDLLGIAKILMDKGGATRSRVISHERNLRNITRHRDAMVRQKTALKNRIHRLVDQLFPGFLDETKSGIPAFTPASCHLMENRFSPAHFRRKRLKTLVRDLQNAGLNHPEKRAALLLDHSHDVMEPPRDLVGTLQTSLRYEVAVYKALEEGIRQVEKEEALLLAATPGAMLTTIRGTGIVLAASVTAEIGPLMYQGSLNRLTSYAGIVPRVKQTGGSENKAIHTKVGKRCNHILKNHLVQCGNQMGLHGPEDLLEDHARRKANGQHADFGIARKYLRTGTFLMRYNQAYLPPALRRDADAASLKTYYLREWPRWRKKWRAAGALEVAFAPENPMGVWRNAIQDIYSITLPL